MNILHVVPYFPPTRRHGGVPEAVLALVRAQIGLGHSVTVLTSDAGLSPEDSHPEIALQWIKQGGLTALGILRRTPVLYVRNRFAILAERGKFFTPRLTAPEVLARLPMVIDAAHFHEVHIPGYWSAAREFARRGAVVCVSPHGSLNPPTHRGVKRIFHRCLDPWLRAGWFSQCGAYFALGRAEREQLLRGGIPPERIHILPHGLPEWEPSHSIPLPFPVEANPAVVTFLVLGRLHESKGVVQVFKAFQALWKNNRRPRLVFCGPDEGCSVFIRNGCHQRGIPFETGHIGASAGVYILSPVPHVILPALFVLADWTICPSPYEAFGLVPIESLHWGVPVVATTGYGCLEYIPQSSPLLKIIPPCDPAALRTALEECLVSPRGERPASGWNPGLPSWREVAERVVEVYQGSVMQRSVGY
ncbi:MAG TPA: glycosyltransferase family 4 protein [bacterium]|nr:glycosyltransferase family 4 protein [bacterium]